MKRFVAKVKINVLQDKRGISSQMQNVKRTEIEQNRWDPKNALHLSWIYSFIRFIRFQCSVFFIIKKIYVDLCDFVDAFTTSNNNK